MVSYALVGRCGLYCGKCMVYRAYKESEKLRKLIAERANCRPDDIRCEGCQIVLTEGWNVEGQQWGKNCKIVSCLEEKRLKFCYECDIFPDCDKFREIYDSQLRHGENLIENLKRIKANEVSEWLEEKEKKWMCEKCGKPISSYEECHWCGEKLCR